MLLELMSNGTLAELPPENRPDGIAMPEEPSVVLLLPHNKYLLGTDGGKWIYASSKSDEQPSSVHLYENQVLSLLNEGTRPTIIPADAVNILRKELFSLSEPPGHHAPTVLMLRTFMKEHSVFENPNDFMLEENFSAFMKEDFILYKAYWTLRFSLARGELETAGRIKAWLRADPNVFGMPQNSMKIWFSILNLPDDDALRELQELSFSSLELKHLAEQPASPLVVYNPLSGWLIIGQFGRKVHTIFRVWLYLNHELYHELREAKKMTVHDIIQAVWGEYDTQQAMKERAKYKGADELNR
ncbi:MAG: hypothetical protein IJS40_03425 [Synergistaceae bacterium]|nr:hypothetical protein [Synergistaceae bacterium]